MLELKAKGVDVSPALAAARQALSDWSPYRDGPGMFSDNYDEEEQNREHFGPHIIETLRDLIGGE